MLGTALLRVLEASTTTTTTCRTGLAQSRPDQSRSLGTFGVNRLTASGRVVVRLACSHQCQLKSCFSPMSLLVVVLSYYSSTSTQHQRPPSCDQVHHCTSLHILVFESQPIGLLSSTGYRTSICIGPECQCFGLPPNIFGFLTPKSPLPSAFAIPHDSPSPISHEYRRLDPDRNMCSLHSQCCGMPCRMQISGTRLTRQT